MDRRWDGKKLFSVHGLNASFKPSPPDRSLQQSFDEFISFNYDVQVLNIQFSGEIRLITRKQSENSETYLIVDTFAVSRRQFRQIMDNDIV